LSIESRVAERTATPLASNRSVPYDSDTVTVHSGRRAVDFYLRNGFNHHRQI
jgi:hypothetical protein